ncbi:hypothetical protein PR202_ga00728 [Eleusine coracana subsp. coracana]|uniref:Reverse transcriptase domain-containing protein n=1 Tax=Eleusine coracana subsp. coracana TaxID=191504 RepID=A0AAV5BGB3_ELECO|nr:hypothetical protein PR202_ga00728 [Eleusine coracana subsp. coracana]
MLFILVMDILNVLIQKASDEGLLQPLARRPLQHRVSLYADDVVMFLRPVASDLNLITEILRVFGTASGLKINIQKSSVAPIRCSEEEVVAIQQLLPCEVADFTCKYLGLPLSVNKLAKFQVQPILANQLPGWKADLMNRAGRTVMVQFVMTSAIIYLAMAVDLPAWALKAMDKVNRGFLWRGRLEAKGGHCLIAWPKVTRPLELGGLGIHDLKTLCWALRMRWLWLKKTQPDKP